MYRRYYRRYRRPRWRSRWRSNVGLKALREVRKLKKETKPELKHKDTAIDLDPYSSNQPVSHVMQISQGDAEDERIGDKIKVISIQFKGMVKQVVSTSSTTYRTRVVIFKEKSPQGVIPAWADVFIDGSIDSLRTLTRASSYQVLFDKTYTTIYDTTNHTIDNVKTIKMFKKINVGNTEYSGTATSPLLNGIYIMATSEVGVTGHMDVTGEFRVRYTDA